MPFELKDFYEAVDSLTNAQSPILAQHRSKQQKKLIEKMWDELPPEQQITPQTVGNKYQMELNYYLQVYKKTHGHMRNFDYTNFLAEVHSMSNGRASFLSIGLQPHIKDYVTAKWNNMNQLQLESRPQIQ